MNDERLIVTGLELPITDVKELRRIAQTCYTEGRKDGAIDELEKIKADFEEIKGPRDNPYNNKTEYSVSMKELRKIFDKHISELKGENKEKPFDRTDDCLSYEESFCEARDCGECCCRE